MKTIDGKTMIAVVRSGAWNSQKTGTDGSVPIFEALFVAGLVLSFITPIIITNEISVCSAVFSESCAIIRH